MSDLKSRLKSGAIDGLQTVAVSGLVVLDPTWTKISVEVAPGVSKDVAIAVRSKTTVVGTSAVPVFGPTGQYAGSSIITTTQTEISTQKVGWLLSDSIENEGRGWRRTDAAVIGDPPLSVVTNGAEVLSVLAFGYTTHGCGQSSSKV